jgi:dimethylamine/trimethylamine dehydrogenase
MCDKVHAHGALAALELTHNGPVASNLYSREVSLAPSHQPSKYGYPAQARAMTLRDIREYRRWHRDAALRGKRAGMDIIYVYAAHDISLAMHFLQRRRNQRRDQYGGSLENRVRLLRELLEETRDAVGDRCAVAVRFATEEFLGPSGVELAEAQDIVGMLAELPDLWDVNVAAWYNDSVPSRFAQEGAQEPFVAFVKKLTGKPVVGVGRFTSPDTMVSQIKRGVLDMIGAARPSIADPFLPKKIEEGRADDIRECIGCNICVTGDMTGALSRCTQNPTFMEEWRKGWHPEIMRAKESEAKVLIVGAGPAGLSAARGLGLRGYQVALAEAGTGLGGRVAKECRLPGLAAWGRVRDYRVGQTAKMPNVEVFLDSQLDAEQVLEFGFDHVAIATGSIWRRDGVARFQTQPMPIDAAMPVFTPDDLMAGNLPSGKRVLVYDDDHYYMGGVLAELLVKHGKQVLFVTPSIRVSDWSYNTLEQAFIQKRLIELGVEIHVTRGLTRVGKDHVETACVYSDRRAQTACDAVLMVTARLPQDALYLALKARQVEWKAAGIRSVKVMGDAQAPAPIAWATYAGHRYAEELDAPDIGDAVPFRREVAQLAAR